MDKERDWTKGLTGAEKMLCENYGKACRQVMDDVILDAFDEGIEHG